MFSYIFRDFHGEIFWLEKKHEHLLYSPQQIYIHIELTDPTWRRSPELGDSSSRSLSCLTRGRYVPVMYSHSWIFREIMNHCCFKHPSPDLCFFVRNSSFIVQGSILNGRGRRNHHIFMLSQYVESTSKEQFFFCISLTWLYDRHPMDKTNLNLQLLSEESTGLILQHSG